MEVENLLEGPRSKVTLRSSNVCTPTLSKIKVLHPVSQGYIETGP